MYTDKPENTTDLNDGRKNSSESDKMMKRSDSQNEEKPQLNYGDIVIMIWRRVKLNIKMSENLKT